MNRPCAALLLLIIIVIAYFVIKYNSLRIGNFPENFTTIDDTDITTIPVDREENFHTKKQKMHYENFNIDTFITYCGSKIRKELVPYNYSDKTYASSKFDESINSTDAPQAHNYYFG